MKRLHLIYTGLLGLFVVLLVNYVRAQPDPVRTSLLKTVEPPPAYHLSTEDLVWAVLIFVLTILGWMFKTWYMELRVWRSELTEKVNDHDKRLVAVETTCELNHDPERHNGSHHKEYVR